MATRRSQVVSARIDAVRTKGPWRPECTWATSTTGDRIPAKALLCLLEDDDLAWLLDVGRVITLRLGQRLVTQGRKIDNVYIVLEGLLSIRVNNRKGTNLDYGNVIGEVSFLVGTKASAATLTAEGEARVFQIPRTSLTTKLAAGDAIAVRLYQVLAGFAAARLKHYTKYAKETRRKLNKSTDDTLDFIIDRLLKGAVVSR